jgi:BTB/POZ domain
MKYNDDDDDDDDDETVFASDDEEIPDEFAEGDHLTWRKENSFSDWTIVITVANEPNDSAGGEEEESESSRRGSCNNKKSTYKVHKERLAMGPRRSGYFARLLNGAAFAESHDNTSHIELNRLAAKAFPAFLDYMYTMGQKMDFETVNATALYSLAEYFDVQRLRCEAKQFCLQDINKTTWCAYYEHAKCLQEDCILQAAMKFIGININKIPAHQEDSELVHFIYKITDVQFWLDLMQEQVDKGTISSISHNLSCYIAHFCLYHDPS